MQSAWHASSKNATGAATDYTGHPDWKLTSTKKVYRITLETPEGREVMLTSLLVFTHRESGDTAYDLSNNGESTFVFADEWPDGDILTVGEATYHPYSMFTF